MAAFERIKSGIPEMDQALDNIRLGDNVVWRVSSLDEFRLFLNPYVEQAIRDHRKLIYIRFVSIRFASHEPLLTEREGLRIVEVELSHRFETFTVEIHHLIEREGRDAFYVFDCLSELQTAWSTDLMMGNFFRVTCPLLFRLDTVAFFPIIRGKHSFEAIAKIKETTQLFLDVYSNSEQVFVRPLKVWNRYSETMFLPHSYDRISEKFRPVMDGIQVSRFYELMNAQQALGADQNTDFWDRFFNTTMEMHRHGMDVTEPCHRMCRIMMTRDEKTRAMVKENFAPDDYFHIRSRMIGTGMVGGKACGMLLARKLIENQRPDRYAMLEPHDSYYVGSDVFYSFIVHNHFWDLRVRQRTRKEYFSLADTFAQKLLEGQFSESLREQFRRMLEYYGQDPIIVRSSSILEDGFGNAFAGKYESVFCANTGSLEERLEELENAIRRVYASTMSKSALDYRLRRGLEGRDEQMALLIQRVSGSRYGDYFMPCAAGVGYSYSPYRFLPSIDPNAGMLRLVMGLGTGAVDRAKGSYPRLVSLDRPEMTSAGTLTEKHQFSQRLVDVIDTRARRFSSVSLPQIEPLLSPHLKRHLLEHNYETEAMFRERGQRRQVLFISCQGLVENHNLMQAFRDILSLIQTAYDYPVDIEFTVNLSPNGGDVINLLQCRPLQVARNTDDIQIPDNIAPESIVLECRHASMGLSKSIALDYIVYVDPIAYYQIEYRAKYTVAQALSAINWYFRGKGKRILLMVPGRICTSSPELGVPTTFADISEFDVICEVSETKAGYMPELSYGSHIFQDLVEADILYGAVFHNEKTLHFAPELLRGHPNVLEEIVPDSGALSGILRLYDVSASNCIVYHDMREQHLLCTIDPDSAD